MTDCNWLETQEIPEQMVRSLCPELVRAGRDLWCVPSRGAASISSRFPWTPRRTSLLVVSLLNEHFCYVTFSNLAALDLAVRQVQILKLRLETECPVRTVFLFELPCAQT
jgi:hypothetical protein